MEAIDNVGEFEDKIHPEVPASFADAVKNAREQEKKAEEVFKDKENEIKDLDNTENQRLKGHSIKRRDGSKKLHLEESLFESYLNDGNLNHLFFKILHRSHRYTLDLNGDLIITDYNNGDTVGIHLDMLQDYDLDYDIFFDPNEDEEFEDIDEAWRREPKEGDTYLVSKNRAPVAELIQAYLTEGEYEWGYVKHANGVINPTPLKGAEYKPWQVGVDYDKDGNTYIKVTAASEEDLEDAIKIANKFGKEYSIKDLGTRGKPNSRFHLLISLNEEDWDEPYVNPEDEVYQGKEEVSNIELEEAFSIKVGVYNYRPSGIEARETYKTIREEGKLNQLQDLLSRMWDDEEVDGDQIDDLLTNEKSWLFKMLDIEEEENQ